MTPEQLDAQRNPNHFYGEKYDRNLTTAEITKLIRADLKREFPGVKFSVRKRKVTWSTAIDVTIKNAGQKIVNPAWVVFYIENSHKQFPSLQELPRYTPGALELLKAVEEVHKSYNYDRSDSMTDYFDVNYYGFVEFDSDVEEAERRYIEELAKVGKNVGWKQPA